MGACASRGRSRSGSNPVHELDRGEDQSIDDASSIKTTAGGSEDANVYEDSAAQGVVRSKPLSELEQYEADLTERDLTLRVSSIRIFAHYLGEIKGVSLIGKGGRPAGV